MEAFGHNGDGYTRTSWVPASPYYDLIAYGYQPGSHFGSLGACSPEKAKNTHLQIANTSSTKPLNNCSSRNHITKTPSVQQHYRSFNFFLAQINVIGHSTSCRTCTCTCPGQTGS